MDHSAANNDFSNRTNCDLGSSEVMMDPKDGSEVVKLNSEINNFDEAGAQSQVIAQQSSEDKEHTSFVESMTEMDILEDRKDSSTHRINEILDFLVKNKKAHFRSQQRGEPDLSTEEKRDIADCLFKKSPSGFLSRYGHLLSKTHLDYFLTFQYPYPEEKEEVLYCLSYLEGSQCKSAKTKVKNRRYDALQKMISSGSYFLMEEMQSRNPLLYEQLVGKYQTDEEKMEERADATMDNDLPLMQYFAKRVEKEQMEKFKQQQEMDEASDGYDDDDDSDEINKPHKETSQAAAKLWGEYRGKFHGETSKVPSSKKRHKERNFLEASEEEKEFYRQEFRAAMYHSFLSGNDKDFDYSTVDNNSEYDCVDMRERDEQDQYFDDESPDSGPYANMDIAEDCQQEPAAVVPNNPKSTSRIVSESDNEENMSDDVCDRLTEDDLQNLKSFASSWAKNHTPSSSQNQVQVSSEPKTRSDPMDINEKVAIVSPPKVPVKKNHKIKINLKTKEM